jgi:hypothetical protein
VKDDKTNLSPVNLTIFYQFILQLEARRPICGKMQQIQSNAFLMTSTGHVKKWYISPKISHNTYILKYMEEKEYLLYTRSLEQMDAFPQVIGNKP